MPLRLLGDVSSIALGLDQLADPLAAKTVGVSAAPVKTSVNKETSSIFTKFLMLNPQDLSKPHAYA